MPDKVYPCRKWLRVLANLLLLVSCVAAVFYVPIAHASAKRAKADSEVNLQADLYALVIGVSQYRAGWPPLQGVKKDVLAVRERLERSGFDVTPVPDPTRHDIEVAFEDIKKKLKGKDKPGRLLVYYAGHGANLNGEGFLVPVDAPEPKMDEAAFREKAVTLKWVRDQLRDMPVRNALLLLDNCFSGAVFKTMRGTPLDSPAIGYMVAFQSREIISAGTEAQTVPDDSIFRRYFEAALSGAGDVDKDGYITGSELAMFLRTKVANESKGQQTPMSAKIDESEKGEFVLLSPLQSGVASSVPVIRKLSPQLGEIARKRITHKQGELFKDCEMFFCPTMMAISGGNFVYGAPISEAGRSPFDLVPSTRQVSGFAMSQHEITFDIWDACFQDGGCSRWPEDMGWGRGGRPVINVTWQDAVEFTEWLSRKTGEKYRLPTEVEWEYAARGGMTTARYWGSDVGLNQASCADCSNSSGGKTAPVGSFPANGLRLHDMLGNVWEWTQDCWNEANNKSCVNHGIRGGSYSTTEQGVRSAARSGYPARNGAKNIGFRVVREMAVGRLP